PGSRLARSPGSRPANSRAARSHLLASSVPYSVNGENSAQPSGPGSRAISRSVMPLNRVTIGRRSTCTSSMRSSKSSGSSAADEIPDGAAADEAAADGRESAMGPDYRPPGQRRPRNECTRSRSREAASSSMASSEESADRCRSPGQTKGSASGGQILGEGSHPVGQALDVVVDKHFGHRSLPSTGDPLDW